MQGVEHVDHHGVDGMITTIIKRHPLLIRTPILGYYSNNHLTALESFEPDADFLNTIKKRGLNIFLFEPMCLYLKPEKMPEYKSDLHNMGFYSEFSSFEDPILIRSTELDSISEWCAKYDVTNAVVHTGDYNAQQALPYYTDILELIYDDIYIKSLVVYDNVLSLPKIKENIDKKFIMANWRFTPARCAVAALLTGKSSRLSWAFTCDYDTLVDTPWLKDLDNSKISGKIREGLNRLNAQAPWSMDLNPQGATAVQENLGHHYPQTVQGYGVTRGPVSTNPFTLSLAHEYAHSGVAIVAESRFAQPTGNYSEKTVLCMLYRTPFIMVASPGSLQAIKEQGYQTFDNWWCEDYDKETNHLVRLEMLFDVIREINSWSTDHSQHVYQEMQEVLEYNFKHCIKQSVAGQMVNTPEYTDESFNVQYQSDI
jgi:hypothetical protein